MPHITDSSFLLNKYSDMQKTLGATELDGTYIISAEAFVEGKLASKYSIPFDATNQTAVDLVLDYAYYIYMLTKNEKRAKAVKELIDNVIEALVDGDMDMVTVDGVIIARDESSSDITWSNTINYTPVFGMGDITDMEVDPDQIEAEDNARD